MKAQLFFYLLMLLFLPGAADAQGILDQPDQDLAWESYRDMSESTYEAKLDELKTKGLRPVDVEIQGGSSRKFAGVWRKNNDGRAWEVRTKLTDSEFSAKWDEMKSKGRAAGANGCNGCRTTSCLRAAALSK